MLIPPVLLKMHNGKTAAIVPQALRRFGDSTLGKALGDVAG